MTWATYKFLLSRIVICGAGGPVSRRRGLSFKRSVGVCDFGIVVEFRYGRYIMPSLKYVETWSVMGIRLFFPIASLLASVVGVA